ncbi:hypothetical protein [Hyphomicrobium sp. MC1]|uniref:hypothetical protein n=1 Tax=Hyphomicrobium sp. (strain MC1) TaxID=717785 RepID=UPI000213D5B6|nr:hypothetical protein [Hyphomicrobium sp. MC1]CCB65030.1 protein of unknown function [Hyphomicrobium sp. MC1]
MALVIAALAAGETYNFFATGERTVIEREAGVDPLRALAKHNAAVRKLAALEWGRRFEAFIAYHLY